MVNEERCGLANELGIQLASLTKLIPSLIEQIRAWAGDLDGGQ